MMQNGNNNKTTATILTLIFPFGGLIYTLNHWRESWAKNAFWLACVYLGAVQIFCMEGTILGSSGDGGRYVLKLMEMYNNPSVSISSIISDFLDPSNEMVVDLYQPLITLLVSRITDNGHVLFAVFACVFGFFYSRNIWYILEKLPNKRLGYLVILVSLFFLTCPITQINGVRMWTALHVFAYGLMPFLLEHDKSKLWWVLLTPFIHFSYLYVAIFAFVFYLMPFRLKTKSGWMLSVAIVFYVATLFVTSLNLTGVNNLIEEYSFESHEERLSGYVSQDFFDAGVEMSAKRNWYVAGSSNVIHWVYSILLIVILPCIKRYFQGEKGLLHLYLFALLFGGFANIMALLPAGGRFQLLSQMFKIPLFLLVAMSLHANNVFSKYFNIACIVLLLPLVFRVRVLLEYYSITAILGDFITVLFWENNVPLIDLIKRII